LIRQPLFRLLYALPHFCGPWRESVTRHPLQSVARDLVLTQKKLIGGE
jgi:hypothetical protein